MADEAKQKCKDPQRGMTSGLIVLGIGVLFLLQNLGIMDFSDSWPLILIIVGLTLVIGAFTRNRKSEDSQV